MNKRIGDLEFRCGMARSPEIVQWYPPRDGGKEFCCTLLWFTKGKEDYYVEFVGDRPFHYHDRDALWKLMVYGNAVCSAVFKLEEE